MTADPATQLPPLPFRLQLRDGTEVLVRYLEPADREELRRGFLRLSVLSRWLRFASPIRRLSEGQLAYLTEVDQVDHIAVGVRDEGAPDKRGVAVGRCIRLRREAGVAEFAITVVDDYQDRGIGTLLLRVLVRAAAAQGIRTFRGFVVGTNARMIHVLEKLGARLQPRLGGMIEAELDLAPGPTGFPAADPPASAASTP